jgi:membrane-associated phospholipid phosphatase
VEGARSAVANISSLPHHVEHLGLIRDELLARYRASSRACAVNFGPQARPSGYRDGGPGNLELKRLPVVVKVWLLSFVVCAAVVVLSFACIDVPMALFFWKVGRFLNPLSKPFGTAIILSLESAVILLLILARLVRGHISLFGEALAIACGASICAYGINGDVLKLLCGVPNPTDLMDGARHTFNIWKGSGESSFPSGHMVLAGAFAGVFMRLYRASIWPLSALLLLAAGVLIVGDWHFLSDVVAGAFLGVSAGMLAGEGWAVHSNRRP